MAYQHSSNRRPWSPAAEDNRGAPAGAIDGFLAHSSHGWAADDFSLPRRAVGGDWNDGYGEGYSYGGNGDRASLARHRANMRFGNVAYDPEYDAENSRFNPRQGYGTSRRQAREPSEVSVEALDLADYAQTLRWHASQAQNEHIAAVRPFPREFEQQNQGQSQIWPYGAPVQRTFSPPSLPYPPQAGIASPPIGAASPPPASFMDRPFSALSRDTNLPPPSLVSGGETSHSSHTNSIFLNQNVNRTVRRPFSLPAEYMAPPATTGLWGAGAAARSSPPLTGSAGRRGVHVEPTLDYGIPEADVSTFPPWARGWYDRDAGVGTRKKLASPPQSPGDDAIFGPYIHPSQIRSQPELPWNPGTLPLAGKVAGADPIERADDVPEEVKEERMRMLEREFGNNSKRGWKEANTNEDTRIGSVDPKGNLITEGPKKRLTLRWLQGILALITAGSGIYGALFIKLKSPAPPSGHAAAYVLYALSIITILLIFWFFVIVPLCIRRRKADKADESNPAGLMVLPVTNPQSTKKKKNKKNKKGGNGAEGNVQVNLIVDPNMFGGTGRGMGGRYDEDDYEDEEYSSNRSSRPRGDQRWDSARGPPPRRSVFQGLALERKWKLARSELKKRCALDYILCIAWGGCFVLILMGQRCPPGSEDGWCNAYNIATAGACVLIVLFGASAFFDTKDLRQSRQSPRTRQ